MSNDKINYRQLAEELYLSRNLKGLDEPEINPTIEGYRKVLKDGLEGKIEKRQDVIVVGAGISGLFSALLLADYGHKVTIIEANDGRVGGRVKTFGQDQDTSPFSEGQYAEAGAMRFPSVHPLVMAYFEKYNLETQLFFNVDVDDPNAVKPNHVNNTFIRTNSFQERRKDYAKKQLPTNDGFYSEGECVPKLDAGKLLDNALDRVRDYYSYYDKETDKRYDFDDRDEWLDGWAQVIEDFDKYSLGGYLREVAELSEGDIGMIGTLTNLSARMPLSFMHSFLGRSDINPGNTYHELKGGSWKLIDVLHKIVKENENITINMDHRMTHIDYRDESNINGDGYKNHAVKANRNISIRSIDENSNENTHILGDSCIITIPFSSLRFVRTNPDFSYAKRRAIIELHYDAATKVLLEFDKRWWEFTNEEWKVELNVLLEEDKITREEYDNYIKELDNLFEKGGRPALNAFGGGSATDNPNRAMYYPSHKATDSSGTEVPGGVILASYTWSDDARRWDSMDDEDRYEFSLRGLTYIHGYKILPFVSGKMRVNGKKRINGETEYIWKKDADGKIKTGVATQSWARNPYAFGEAAVFEAYQFTTLHPNIPNSEGPVFFAGEHTSLKHAWVEGSLESAIRVSQEVIEAIFPVKNEK